jgi:hypothetical protein
MKRNLTLADIPDGVIECWALKRHKLDLVGDVLVVGTVSRPKLIERHWRCTSCPVEAWDQMNVNMWRRAAPRRYDRHGLRRPQNVSYDDIVAEYYIRTSTILNGRAN